MIQETIVTTQNKLGNPHIAPMGIHVSDDELIILPFRPSTTLNNLLETGVGVINYCDDVRVFAGCLTGRKAWPLTDANTIEGKILECALAHAEIAVTRIEDDDTRPKLFCKILHTVNHKPFVGFIRAQYSVLEAAILLSRLHWLPAQKIESELDYLRIGFEKTAGPREKEAWQWIMTEIDAFKRKHSA